MKHEPTHQELYTLIQDVLYAVNGFAQNTEQRFAAIDVRFEAIDKRLETIDQRFEGLEGRVGSIESRMGTMVTKDYLDEKLYDLRGDLIQLTRKEDKKLAALVEVLEHREAITKTDAKRVLDMQPFARPH